LADKKTDTAGPLAGGYRVMSQVQYFTDRRERLDGSGARESIPWFRRSPCRSWGPSKWADDTYFSSTECSLPARNGWETISARNNPLSCQFLRAGRRPHS